MSLKSLATGAALLLALPAFAQDYPADQGEPPPAQQQPPAEEAATADSVTDSELEEFATAMEKVDEIRTTAQSELASAEDPEQAQAVQDEATKKMMGAIEETDISVERYNEIARGLMQDPGLQARLQSIAD